MNQQIRINAAISYMFIGGLFLLSDKKEFNEPFVRDHAKNAVKLHLLFLVTVVGYFMLSDIDFLSSIFYFKVPILLLSVHVILMTLIFSVFTGLIIRGAYRAFNGTQADELKIRKDMLKLEESYDETLTETQKMLYIVSNIPFVGPFIATKYRLPLNLYGEKISGIASIIIVILVITNHRDILSLVMLVFIAYLVFSAIIVITQSKVVYTELILKIPSVQEAYLYVRAGFRYIGESMATVFGKREDVSYVRCLDAVLRKEERFMELAKEHLNEDRIFLSNKLVYLPGVNLIYLFKFFMHRKSRYVIAIAQGLIIDALVVAVYFLDNGYQNSITQVIFLIPIILGMANIDSNPYYKIPVIFDLYMLLDKLTFGAFDKLRFLKENKEMKEVSFKV